MDKKICISRIWPHLLSFKSAPYHSERQELKLRVKLEDILIETKGEARGCFD